MRVVLSLGGSVMGLDAGRIREFGKAIERVAEDNDVFVVVGGGRVARDYIRVAKELGADDTFCDYVGIGVTRLNAMLLAATIKEAPKVIPKDFREAYELSLNHRVVVMGGTFPGHTTDATSALLAEFVRADVLLNATAVDGIYTDDPKKNPKAKRFERIKAEDLLKIVTELPANAGANFPLDPLSVMILRRSGIRAVVFLGEPENIEKALKGEIGTLVIP